MWYKQNIQNMSNNSLERLNAALQHLESRRAVKKAEPAPSPDEIRYRSLLIAMEHKNISFAFATKIVGGKVRLMSLMESGAIRNTKPDGASNRKWLINAADCYRNIRPRI